MSGLPTGEGFVTGIDLDEAAFTAWASALGVPVDRLVMAVVAGSEVTTLDEDRRVEQGLVMECLCNRAPFVGFRRGFPGRPGSLFSVAVAPKTTTGPQSEGRPFSSSRIAVGAALRYLLDLAAEVQRRVAAGEGHQVTSFVHKKGPALEATIARWRALGYQEAARFPQPNGKTGVFFAPTESKLRDLGRAARRGK